MKTKKNSVVVTRSCCSFGPGMSRMLYFHRKMSIARSIGGWVDPRTGFNVSEKRIVLLSFPGTKPSSPKSSQRTD